MFVGDLKKRLLSGELGGDRREMWWKVRKARLGLIDAKESEVSEVTEGEAKEVRFTFVPVAIPASFTNLTDLAVLVLHFSIVWPWDETNSNALNPCKLITLSHDHKISTLFSWDIMSFTPFLPFTPLPAFHSPSCPLLSLPLLLLPLLPCFCLGTMHPVSATEPWGGCRRRCHQRSSKSCPEQTSHPASPRPARAPRAPVGSPHPRPAV